MPRISVLVPCFNQGAWLDEALDSVFAQTVQDFEILVVDDGSDDETTTAKLSTVDRPRTRVVRTANRGLPAARNEAARHASGEIICALDADDRLAPAWFEKGLGVLDARPEIAFVSHWFETFGDEHWTWTPERCDLVSMLARNAVNGAALVRRAAFESVGGYDERMREGCEDWDFWLRLIEAGHQGAIVPEVLFHYRRHAQSMSRQMTSRERYAAPLRMLLYKHEASFRAHAVDVLVRKDAEMLALLRETHGLESDHLTGTRPALARAREELAAVTRKRVRLMPRIDAGVERQRLRADNDALRRRVGDLERSWSWRLTAPLRTVVGWARGERR
jgi:glycosyltransferase involved in cell wall biosynthesis